MLDEVTSKHVIQVLRMQLSQQLQLTDGKGNLFVAAIVDDNRKRCAVQILSVTYHPRPSRNTVIAISPVKNNSRFEWFVEKATEIAVTGIVPLLCERTEKTQFKWERLKNIVVSAMLQSQQVWLPRLHEAVKFETYVQSLKNEAGIEKYIAHCEDENHKNSLRSHAANTATKQVILIGPEGDFTKSEIGSAIAAGFVAVTLGDTRLRTETAGIVAATILTAR